MLIANPKSEWPALTFDHQRNTSNTMSKRHSTYIHQHDRTQLLSSVKSLSTHIHWHHRKHHLSSMEGLSTYIRPCEEPIQPTCRKGSALTFDHARNQSSLHVERDLNPRLRIPGNWLGASILPENGISPYIWSSGNASLNHIRMALHLYLIMWEHIPKSYQNGPQP